MKKEEIETLKPIDDERTQSVYIAGPMRGIPKFNFPAFDKAAADWMDMGFNVVNPADMDRARGFNEEHPPTGDELASFIDHAILCDLRAIVKCDAIVMLPGWKHSKGCAVEVALAKFLGLPILDAGTGRAIKGLADAPETVAEEATRIVNGDRCDAYGHPYDDFSRAALMWSGIIGQTITPEQVSMCMVALKLSRQCNGHKRDNIVDGIGYFLTLEKVITERARRAALKKNGGL